jgi:hypothetical protein
MVDEEVDEDGDMLEGDIFENDSDEENEQAYSSTRPGKTFLLLSSY